MGTTTKTLHGKKLLSASEALDLFFCDIADERVKAELYKWFFFGVTGKGNTLHHLPPEQLALFADKLQDLVVALYAFQTEQRKEETHEP
ncbi:hypothetical protein D0C36_22965 [Mucilaginibacter conchicola]|uniref:Uncharacterized protein n=1 Tax=Mucilaginibacter conchicola TaxID=2303333 RepID=A0A372NMD5_9SPHI|nr:hypothetical protein [Mucilaginibacter conchicola]RFZ90106.1 hypothetical protein D0C36_22965 [Mucilaginibacter conchicola]